MREVREAHDENSQLISLRLHALLQANKSQVEAAEDRNTNEVSVVSPRLLLSPSEPRKSVLPCLYSIRTSRNRTASLRNCVGLCQNIACPLWEH